MIGKVEGIGKEEDDAPAKEPIEEVVGDLSSRSPKDVVGILLSFGQCFSLC